MGDVLWLDRRMHVTWYNWKKIAFTLKWVKVFYMVTCIGGENWKYMQKNTNLPQVTDKLHYIRLTLVNLAMGWN